MNLRNDILDELAGLSSLLAGIEKTNVFTVPEGYFNDLDETILGTIKENDIALTNGFSKDIVFEIPKGYFENLPDKILNKIKAQQPANAAEELMVLSPMLYSVQNENVFETPAGYFTTVADSILNKVKLQPAKVIVMHKRRMLLKYASAAMITVVVGLGIYKFANNASRGSGPSNNILTFASLDSSIQSGIKMNETQFNQSLNTLSEDDIANYLDKNGNDADVAELSSSIDDNSLPNQEQYLLDDKTLDNYLSDDNAQQKSN